MQWLGWLEFFCHGIWRLASSLQMFDANHDQMSEFVKTEFDWLLIVFKLTQFQCDFNCVLKVWSEFRLTSAINSCQNQDVFLKDQFCWRKDNKNQNKWKWSWSAQDYFWQCCAKQFGLMLHHFLKVSLMFLFTFFFDLIPLKIDTRFFTLTRVYPENFLWVTFFAHWSNAE